MYPGSGCSRTLAGVLMRDQRWILTPPWTGLPPALESARRARSRSLPFVDRSNSSCDVCCFGHGQRRVDTRARACRPFAIAIDHAEITAGRVPVLFRFSQSQQVPELSQATQQGPLCSKPAGPVHQPQRRTKEAQPLLAAFLFRFFLFCIILHFLSPKV